MAQRDHFDLNLVAGPRGHSCVDEAARLITREILSALRRAGEHHAISGDLDDHKAGKIAPSPARIGVPNRSPLERTLMPMSGRAGGPCRAMRP